MPPPLALSLKVKYPDIYNRYRKLKGPIKATKPLKTRRAGVNRIKAEATPVGETSLNGITAEDAGVEHQFVDGTGDMEMDQRVSVELARLASKGHVDLAQALLRLPRGGQEGEQVHLDEAMLRMARMESAGAQEERSETAWDTINM